MPTMSALRAFNQDPAALARGIKPGTLRRTLAIAAPYGSWLLLLAVVVVANASISIANSTTPKSAATNGDIFFMGRILSTFVVSA